MVGKLMEFGMRKALKKEDEKMSKKRKRKSECGRGKEPTQEVEKLKG
jgi:hypothetical protein